MKQERYPLESTTVSTVAVNNSKTGKTNEKEIISTERFKINSNKEKNQKASVVYFQKNHSPLKQKAVKINELIWIGKKPESSPF